MSTIHRVSNSFADKLFTILHCHLLPKGNSLTKNHHVAQLLISKLGLLYNNIHAYGKWCVLFMGEYFNAKSCSKCDGPKFSDKDCKKFLVKVLRQFPIIPKLQRMFYSLTIPSLMKWHKENQSDTEGRDGLIRHLCDSKAWKHFHNNMDPIFGDNARNIHFALAADGVNPCKQTHSI
jgi:hypothetical protein